MGLNHVEIEDVTLEFTDGGLIYEESIKIMDDWIVAYKNGESYRFIPRAQVKDIKEVGGSR